MRETTIRSPRGKETKVLLSSVFGPYARDDEFGSRAVNPMELYHNQVTRLQGGYSLRMFHRSFGLMMIQSNIEAPCTLLDFPTQERFISEIRDNQYDLVGISGILPNIDKVKRMCELVRQFSPASIIVVGGHITGKDDLSQVIDADFIVKGDGIGWLRRFLGEDVLRPLRHPAVLSCFGGRIMGIPLSCKANTTAAILVPSVGCPVGCNFCSTSALFGGKGNFKNFYESGDDLFEVMSRIADELKTNSFFILDENFLLHRKRALRLMELMERHHKSWSLFVFSSARVLEEYDLDQLVRLGVTWVWMGLEGENSAYGKLRGVDTRTLVSRLQTRGIRVLGSSIIGLEGHTPETMDAVIDYAVSHETVFHQFMLYTANAGTPLYEKHRQEGTLKPEEEFPLADAHGQYRFNYRHEGIRNGEEEGFLLDAFRRDFRFNGPSLARMIAVMLNGWKFYRDHPDTRIRTRLAREIFPLRSAYAGAVWAMKKWYRDDERLSAKMDDLVQDLYATFGWFTRIVAPPLGLFAYWSLRREEKRLAGGFCYEPETVCEKNAAAVDLAKENTARSFLAVPSFPWKPAKSAMVIGDE